MNFLSELIKIFCLKMVYVYTNNDEDLYELLILPVLYFECKIFFQAKVVRSWTRFREIQEQEKVLLWLKYPCTVPIMLKIYWIRYLFLIYEWRHKEWCTFDAIFQPYKRGIPMLSVYGEGWRWSWMVEILTSTNDSRLLNKSVLCLENNRLFW